MSAAHVPEPWHIGMHPQWRVPVTFGPDGLVLSKDDRGEDVMLACQRRGVACVNACAGFDLLWLEDRFRTSGPGFLFRDAQQAAKSGTETAKQIGDAIQDARSSPDLLAVCKAFVDYFDRHGGTNNLATTQAEYAAAKRAIAKAGGVA